jgi:hypothetical protein
MICKSITSLEKKFINVAVINVISDFVVDYF